MSKKKYNFLSVITGASGFIGTHLASKLIKEKHLVAGLPRTYLENPQLLDQFFKEVEEEAGGKIDYIYHLASYGNHHTQREDIDEIFSTNIVKTYFLLKASSRLKLKGFFNFSTSAAYGDKKTTPARETQKLQAEDFYGVTKISSEYLAKAFHKKFDLPVVNIRPYSVYGEGEALFRFIPRIIKSIEVKEEFDLTPKPTHDWIYIEDFINGVLTVTESIEDLKGKPINIGTGKSHTNMELVKMLEKIGKDKANYNLNDKLRGGRNFLWQANNDNLKKLGWKQKYSLEQGLTNTYNFYKDVYKNEKKQKTKKKNT